MIAYAVYMLMIYLPILAVCLALSRKVPPYNGTRAYRTSLTQKSPAHWEYGNKLAPKVFFIADQLFALLLLLYVLFYPLATLRDVGGIALFLFFMMMMGCIGFLEYRMSVYDRKLQ